jgi:hypothetical protein
MADVIPLDAERRKRTSYRLVGFRSVRRAGYFCVEPDLLTAYELASLRAQATSATHSPSCGRHG